MSMNSTDIVTYSIIKCAISNYCVKLHKKAQHNLMLVMERSPLPVQQGTIVKITIEWGYAPYFLKERYFLNPCRA